MTGMAIMFSNMDDNRNAVKAGRQALELHPNIPNLKQLIERFGPTAEGQGI
jgi:primosomal protein N'